MTIRCRQKSMFAFGHLLLFVFGFISAEPGPKSDHEQSPFAIEFKKTKITFSGSVDSKDTVDTLAKAVAAVRPDLKIVNSGLAFAQSVDMPDISLLTSLIVEIALSTAEGVFELSDSTLVVGGLTDSVVTKSVLRLRAEPLLGNRRFREEVCLVPTEDLPEIPVLLSTGESRKAYSFSLGLEQKEVTTFEPPGIILTKLLSLIEGTADPDIYPELPVSSSEPATLSASQIPPAGAASPVQTVMAEDQPQASLPVPPSPYEEFGPILFVRNSAVLQSGQRKMVSDLIPVLTSEPWKGSPIIVRSLIYQSGSEVFAKWVADRRLANALRVLSTSGFNPNLLKGETAPTTETIDRGEVKLLLMKPPGYVSPSEETSTEQNNR